MNRLSLVIPTLDRHGALYNLLRHLEHQTQAPNEIVIVDQSEGEDSRLAAYAAAHPQVRYHRIPVRGLPNARNVGISLSSGDVVLFVDDDIIPDRDLVRRHLADYADPSVSGVGGRVLGGYDEAGAGVGRFKPAGAVVVRNFGADTPCEVDHLPGGNMSFRREVFARTGAFDTSYGGSAIGEETDFCLRARRCGFKLIFDPGAAVEHLHLPTGGCRTPHFEEWLYWHAHNGMLFALRYARRAGLPIFVLKRLARFVLFALEHGNPVHLAVGLKGLARGASAYLSGP